MISAPHKKTAFTAFRTVELWWYKMWVQRWSRNERRWDGGVYGVLIHCSLMDRKQEDNSELFWLLFFYLKKIKSYLSVFVFIFIRLLISTNQEVITLSGVQPIYHNNTLIQTYSSKQPRNNNQSPFDKQYLTINTGKFLIPIPISHPWSQRRRLL